MKKIILILVILLCPVLSLADSFGNANIEATSIQITDDIVMGRFTCGGTGSLDSIQYYGWNQGDALDYKCAVYRYDDGSLLDSTTIQNVASDPVAQWRNFQFVGGATVKTDTVYYLCVWADSTDASTYVRTRRGESVGSQYKVKQLDFENAWPASITSWEVTGSDLVVSIVAYFTAEGEPPAESNVIHFKKGHYRKISR